MLLKTLLDGGLIDGNCLTVTGKTMKENLKNVKFNNNRKLCVATTINYKNWWCGWFER